MNHPSNKPKPTAPAQAAHPDRHGDECLTLTADGKVDRLRERLLLAILKSEARRRATRPKSNGATELTAKNAAKAEKVCLTVFDPEDKIRRPSASRLAKLAAARTSRKPA